MKKILKAPLNLLLAVLAAVVALVFGVGMCFYLPIDYIRYKRSPYYKKVRKKYDSFAGTGRYFKVYNEILANDLPIQYIANPKDDSLERGRLVFKDTLIIPNFFNFEYDPETGVWQDCYEDEDGKRTVMELQEFIEMEIQDANEQVGQTICKEAIVLISAKDLKDVEQAKNEKKFLIYEKNLPEVLKNYCNEHLP